MEGAGATYWSVSVSSVLLILSPVGWGWDCRGGGSCLLLSLEHP